MAEDTPGNPVMGSLTNSVAVGGATAVGIPVVQYFAQWFHMPAMPDSVAGAISVVIVLGIHAAAIIAQKKWGVNILPASKKEPV